MVEQKVWRSEGGYLHRIYLASSWRNPNQPALVEWLRKAGHEVYDFHNPPTGGDFSWDDRSLWGQDWSQASAETHRTALAHGIVKQTMVNDGAAMRWATTGILLSPCGRSAHMEIGYMIGLGKLAVNVIAAGTEPEVTTTLCHAQCIDWAELMDWLHYNNPEENHG